MKKITTLILTLLISISSFAIVDFDGIEWGEYKTNVSPILKNSKPFPSINPNIEILIVENVNENIKSYKFYFANKQLFKIRVEFNKEVVGSKELKIIYKKLINTLGNPTQQAVINEKIGSLTLRGNYIKFSPDLSTNVYYIGVDTINSKGKINDSNLYLDYVPSTEDYKFEI